MSKQKVVILIVEDDDRVRLDLQRHLTTAGYEVIVATDGQEALVLFESAVIDLVVLDVLMPKLDGFQVCQSIRQYSNVPIIMTTVLGSASDRVTGLEMGANDYLVKPFSSRELIARIRAILRRTLQRSEEIPSTSPSMIQVGRLAIDSTTRRVYRDGDYIRLTELEFRILQLLARQPGKIFSRADILQEIWGYTNAESQDSKIVDVHMSRLRIKLEQGATNFNFIVTIRGRGYMLLNQRH